MDDFSDEELMGADEITEYLSKPISRLLEEDKVLDWWMAERESYPRLFRAALDLLSIPAMSSVNERPFSQTKLVITSQRHRLHHNTVNQIECLKDWIRAGDFKIDEIGFTEVLPLIGTGHMYLRAQVPKYLLTTWPHNLTY
jgi:hypothetical protein